MTTQMFGGIAVAILVSGAPAFGQAYDFTFDPASSGLSGDLDLTLGTGGTLIGDYDEEANPTGTRTKPGANPFESFGDTENEPVDLSLGIGLGGVLDTMISGGLRLRVDAEAGVVGVSNYTTTALGDPPATLPIQLALEFDAFRTRAPESVYVGGIPLEIPLGEAGVTNLALSQTPGETLGVLTPVDGSPGTFDFIVAPTVTVEASVSLLGNETALPAGVPVPIPLAGRVTLTDDGATLDGMFPVMFMTDLMPDFALPQIPFGLPTLLPPGETANVLLDLSLSEASVNVDTTLSLSASGVLVPAPASAMGLVGLGAFALRRRR